jgi:hypothetical protein
LDMAFRFQTVRLVTVRILLMLSLRTLNDDGGDAACVDVFILSPLNLFDLISISNLVSFFFCFVGRAVDTYIGVARIAFPCACLVWPEACQVHFAAKSCFS